jgi:ribonuclease I
MKPKPFTSLNRPECRAWFADGEELAEGGIKEWLADLRPYLEAQGVRLASVEDVEAGEAYRLSINGRDQRVQAQRS